MNPKKPSTPRNLPDLDSELENDTLWNLLDEASPAETSPRFAQDTLRRLRLEESTQNTAWWKKLLTPKPLIGTAATALAAVAIVISLPNDSTPVDQNQQADTTPSAPTENWEQLENTLAEELLSAAAEDPTLLSDEEIVSLLF